MRDCCALDKRLIYIRAYFAYMAEEAAERGRRIVEAIDEAKSLMTELNTKREDFLRSFLSGALINFLGQGREWFENFVDVMRRTIDVLEQAEEPVHDLRDRLDRAVDRFRKIDDLVYRICKEIEESKHMSESHKETLSSKFPEILEIIMDLQDLSHTIEERAKNLFSLFERFTAISAYLFQEEARSG